MGKNTQRSDTLRGASSVRSACNKQSYASLFASGKKNLIVFISSREGTPQRRLDVNSAITQPHGIDAHKVALEHIDGAIACALSRAGDKDAVEGVRLDIAVTSVAEEARNKEE